MAEEVKDEQVAAQALEAQTIRDTRSIFHDSSKPAHESQPIEGVAAPVFISGPHKFYQKQELLPMTRLERDIPWKLVFVLYAIFAVGGLVLFGVFLVTMIRIYKQQVY